MNEGRSILIVEDDGEIRSLLSDFLGSEGYKVHAVDGGAALDRHLAGGPAPDLVVLDWMLPGEDGLSICRRLRGAGVTPILMLTAKAEDIDRILGLEMGADDYLTKPFNPRVLLAHVRALLRRAASATGAQGDGSAPLRVCDLLVDPATRRVLLAEGCSEVTMTAAEFDLLACFVERPQRVLSREQLLDWTRGRSADVFDRTIDVQVSRLRKRLDDAGSTASGLLKTVRNAGYILSAPVRTA